MTKINMAQVKILMPDDKDKHGTSKNLDAG
jgi:hypothetical protein